MPNRLASDSSQRRFAESIVRRIVEQHHIAYFAGGCVRDNLLGIEPSDYDIATSATPEQVQAIFGTNRTLFVGAAFGVVCVHQRIDSILHQVEVATFRSDGDYSDGRRPDRVEFTTPEGDAQRRDFTINGLFYDPIAQQVIDFVEGVKDLDQCVLRAIGNARARFSEDKLRLLRAVRIAARFDFEIEPNTQAAIIEMASQVQIVSPERIAAEMQKMLAHRSRAAAIELLFHFGLLLAVFPELAQSLSDESTREKTLLRLKAIEQEDFIAAVAVLCYAFLESLSDSKYFEACKRVVKELKLRWRLSNEDAAAVEFTIHNAPIFLTADQVHWSVLQPLLISPFVKHSLQFVRSLDVNEKVKTAILLRCASALKLPNNELNPPFLVDGHMLMKAGLPTGPEYARLIKLARAAQLDGVIRTHDEALEWVRRHCRF